MLLQLNCILSSRLLYASYYETNRRNCSCPKSTLVKMYITVAAVGLRRWFPLWSLIIKGRDIYNSYNVHCVLMCVPFCRFYPVRPARSCISPSSPVTKILVTFTKIAVTLLILLAALCGRECGSRALWKWTPEGQGFQKRWYNPYV